MDRTAKDRLPADQLGIGKALRRAREQRGLTISQVSEATKIRSAHLLALEEEDFADLPAPVFARGLLRTYSRHLGLNVEEMIALLDRHHLLGGVARIQPATPRLRAGGSVAPRLLAVVLTVSLFGGLGYYLYAQYNAFLASEQVVPSGLPTAVPAIAASLSTPEPTAPSVLTPQPTPAQPASSQPTPAQPMPVPPTLSPSPSPSPTPTVVRIATVEAQFTGDCWVKAEVDDAVVIKSQTFHAGDKVTWTGRKLFIRFGNAGAVEIRLNGKPLGRLGAPGQPVDWKWTAP